MLGSTSIGTATTTGTAPKTRRWCMVRPNGLKGRNRSSKVPRSKSSDRTVTGDAKEAWHLIANARAAGIDLASVTVGGCRIELRAPVVARGADDEVQSPRDAIYERFGGEMYRRMQGRPGTPAVKGEEYQPALEVEQ